MSDSTDHSISNRLHTIFPSPVVAARIVDLVTSKRPKGWSHKSHAPYYKAIFANEIRGAIDQMILNKKSIIYRYSTWCTEDTGISKQTVYHRVNQSIRYLIECMDTPEHTYAKWYEEVTVSRDSKVGAVVISYIPGLGDNTPNLKPEIVEPKSTRPRWEKRMDDWLEGTDVEPFVQEKLALSQEEIVELKVRLCQLKTVMCSITPNSVKLIRTNDV